MLTPAGLMLLTRTANKYHFPFGLLYDRHGNRTGFSQADASDAGGVAPCCGGDGESRQDADRSGRSGGREPPVCRSVGQGGGAVRRGGLREGVGAAARANR